MKKFFLMTALALACCATTYAKDLKVLVVKTTPEMHCNNCEMKIKNNVRFTAGVKRIETNLETKQVTITYDAEKTNAQTIQAAFKKIGYDATIVSDGGTPEKVSKKQPVDGVTGSSMQQKQKK